MVSETTGQDILRTLEATTRPAAPDLGVLTHTLQSHYPQIGALTRLSGEADLNYRATTQDGPLMVKLSAVDDGEFCRFPGQLLDQLAAIDPTLPLPRVVSNDLGGNDAIVEPAGVPLLVSVTSWIDGRPARDVPMSPGYLHDVGRVLGQLDRALADVSLALPDRPTPWDLATNAHAVGSMVQGLDGRSGAELADELFAFSEECGRLLQAQESQLIHNDLNPDNVVVDAASDRPVGILDFGDVISAPLAVEVGTAAAYFVDTSSADGLLSSFGAFVRGFRAEAPLDEADIWLVPRVMRARWAFALSINAARAAASPDDAAHVAYVTRNSAAARRRLELCQHVPHDALVSSIR